MGKYHKLVVPRISKVYGLLENLYGFLRHAGFFIGPSQIFHIPALVERVEADCLLHLVDCSFRLADEDEEIGHFREELRVVRIEFSGAQVMRHRLLVLPVVQICPPQCPLSLIIVGIEASRRAGVLERELKRFVVIVRPLVVVIVGIGPGEASVGAGIVRVDFPGLLKKIARRRVAFTGEFMPLVPASREVIVGGEAVRVFPSQAFDLGLSQFAGRTPERSDDGPRDLVTNCEYAFYLPVIAVGPELAPVLASINCAVTRTLSSERWMLPSTT